MDLELNLHLHALHVLNLPSEGTQHKTTSRKTTDSQCISTFPIKNHPEKTSNQQCNNITTANSKTKQNGNYACKLQ